MFQAEEVERDKYGFWLHSAFTKPAAEEVDVTKLPISEGMEFRFVDFEGDASEELHERYHSDVGLLVANHREAWCEAVSEWEPTWPPGEGWFIVGIYDTEDGPCAAFARPKNDKART